MLTNDQSDLHKTCFFCDRTAESEPGYLYCGLYEEEVSAFETCRMFKPIQEK